MKNIVLGVIGVTSLVSAANAGFTGFIAFSRNVGGNTVVDIFAATTNPNDRFLNVYDLNSNGTFVQRGTLSAKTWKPDYENFTNIRQTTDDSFMTAGTFSGGAYGGDYYAASWSRGDPNFTGTSWNATAASAPALTIPALAGWYTGDPTSIENNAEVLSSAGTRVNSSLVSASGGYQPPSTSQAATRGVWVSHLVIPGNDKVIGVDFSFTASASIKDGVNGATTQARYMFVTPDTDGDGIVDTSDACPTLPGPASCNGCPVNACGGCGAPPDGDGDGLVDCLDNCPGVVNPGQEDCDSNGTGDACQSFPDCNGNGRPDSCDIAGGTPDCNGNGRPDSCDIALGEADCDLNGVPDTCEIAAGAQDCNSNGVLDLCEITGGAPDCNSNGRLDSCDVSQGTSSDVNGNGVPDECKPDCNGNQLPDEYEIAQGMVPDCNGDGVPDTCQGASPVKAASGNLGAPSGAEVRSWTAGSLLAAESAVTITIDLRGDLDGQTEWVDVSLNDGKPRRFFEADGDDCPETPNRAVITLNREEFNAIALPSGSLTVRIAAPPTVDPSECKGSGLTAVSLSYTGVTPSGDCNRNGRLDICETNDGTTADCNGNDVPDSCDIASGTAADCNGNAIPDGCEIASNPAIDCDGNGIPDSCDVAVGGAVTDCNGNGRLDSCELTEIPGLDCNGNGRIDSCDIASGASEDVDGNGQPDDCQTFRVPQQFPTIQSAIDAIPAGQMRIVQVSAGTYAGPVDFRGKRARVIGAGAATTVIAGSSGQLSSVVRAISNEPSLALLKGFTVRGGNGGSQLPGATGVWCGGGMVAKGASMSVTDCVFEMNAASFGGGVYLTQCGGRFERNTVRNNNAYAYGGGMRLSACTTEVVSCVFTENNAQITGGAIHVAGGTAKIRDSAFANNAAYERGAAIAWDPLQGGATNDLLLDTVSITNNHAGIVAGGLYVYPWAEQSQTAIEDSVICGNSPRNVVGRFQAFGTTEVCDCSGDCNLDTFVDGADLSRVLSGWGISYDNDLADVNLDGVINGIDLGAVLTNWGSCGGN